MEARRPSLKHAVGLLFVAACTRSEPAKPDSAKPIVAQPVAPIVVSVVVDQLAAWIVSERLSELRPDGGFARLAREGTWARDMRFAHATCDTAPGHASLYTGVVPRENGIFVNEVLDPSFEKISILTDLATTQVDAWGVREGETSVSTSKLRAPTVADDLRKARPDAVIVSLSIKDRGAVFGGGKSPTDVVWYDASKGNFVTSTAFAKMPVPWLKASWTLDHEPLVRNVWSAPLRSDWVRAHAKTADHQPGEGDYLGLGTTYPHDPVATSSPMKAFRMTPFSDTVILHMALRALDERHAAEHPTLLALSLSANDYIGHTFGPDSWEAWDELDRLDVELATFMRGLDERYGSEGWSLLLAADHGVTRLPELSDHGERFIGPKLTAELQAEAEEILGKGRWIAGVADPWIVLTDAARKLPADKSQKLARVVTETLALHRGVDRVIASFPSACPAETDESTDALVCRSHVDGADADFYVLAKPGSFFDTLYTEGAGTSHGNPAIFDRSVPFFVRAPKHADAGKVIAAPTTFRAYAKTLSILLGLAKADPDAIVR